MCYSSLVKESGTSSFSFIYALTLIGYAADGVVCVSLSTSGSASIKCTLLFATYQDIAQWSFCLCLYWHLSRNTLMQCYGIEEPNDNGLISILCIYISEHTLTQLTIYIWLIKRWKLKWRLFNTGDKVVWWSTKKFE